MLWFAIIVIVVNLCSMEVVAAFYVTTIAMCVGNYRRHALLLDVLWISLLKLLIIYEYHLLVSGWFMLSTYRICILYGLMILNASVGYGRIV